MVISAFIEQIGLGPARRVFHLLAPNSNNQNINMPPYDLVSQHCEFPCQRPRSTTAEEGQEEQRFSQNNQAGFRGGFQKLCRYIG